MTPCEVNLYWMDENFNKVETYELSKTFIVGNVTRTVFNRDFDLSEKSYRFGKVFMGSELREGEITMTCTYDVPSSGAVDPWVASSTAIHNLMGWLDPPEVFDLVLELSSETIDGYDVTGTIMYKVKASGGQVENHMGGASVELRFVCPDPCGFTEPRTLENSGGVLSIFAESTAPSHIVVEATGTPASRPTLGDSIMTFTVDTSTAVSITQHEMAAVLPLDTGEVTLRFDSRTHSCKRLISGGVWEAVPVTLDTVFPILPGNVLPDWSSSVCRIIPGYGTLSSLKATVIDRWY